MPNLILDLEVDRVDLVDEGANSASFIKMYKRKETEKVMEFTDILKSLKPEHASVVEAEITKARTIAEADEVAKAATAKAELETVTTDLEKAKKELGDVKEEIAKSKPQDTEPDFETVLKNLDPSVQKVFKSMQAQKEAAESVAKAAAEEKEEQEAVTKAKDLKALPVDEAKLVSIVKGIDPEVFEVLKAASKALEDGGLFDELGVAKGKDTPASNSDAWDQIEKAAKTIADDQKVTIEKARTMAIKENPALYREYLKGDVN